MEKQEEYLVQAISDYLFEMCFAIISKNMSVKSSIKKYHIYTRFVPGYMQPQIIVHARQLFAYMFFFAHKIFNGFHICYCMHSCISTFRVLLCFRVSGYVFHCFSARHSCSRA